VDVRARAPTQTDVDCGAPSCVLRGTGGHMATEHFPPCCASTSLVFSNFTAGMGVDLCLSKAQVTAAQLYQQMKDDSLILPLIAQDGEEALA